MPGETTNNSDHSEYAPKQLEIRKYFGSCYEIPYIPDGCTLPVGGSIFSDEQDITCIADLSSFEELFLEIHKLMCAYNMDNLRKWLNDMNFDIDPPLFAQLVAFTKKLAEEYPIHKENQYLREKLYREKAGTITLSDVFSKESAMCAEIAALAQGYLQQEQISSSYFNGDVLWKEEYEFSEKHTFVVIRTEAATYIYDPANPLKTNQGTFPQISKLTVDFDQELAKGKRRFVTAIDIMTNKPIYYGVNNNTNVFAERDIV